MNNEDTHLINENDYYNANPKANGDNNQLETKSDKKVKNKDKTVAAGVGGFVGGVAVGGAGMAMAQNSDETVIPEENLNVTTDTEEASNNEGENTEGNTVEMTPETPAPEQVILANDEGIRYAHVEADNFNDAFAQARSQVGAGGVFEYNGKLYGTYYADEWNEMSADDRATYQSRVNGIAPSHHHEAPAHSANSYDMADSTHQNAETIPTNAEMIDVEPVDTEIRILGVEAIQNPDGQIMNVALLEAAGDQALLIDVDNDGIMDVLLHDDNGNNQIEESEIHNISGSGIEVADLVQAQAGYDNSTLYVANDDMPDYINDADFTMNV